MDEEQQIAAAEAFIADERVTQKELERLAKSAQAFIRGHKFAALAPSGMKKPREYTQQEVADRLGMHRSAFARRLADPNSGYPKGRKQPNNRRTFYLHEIHEIMDIEGIRPKRPEGSKAARIAVANFKGGVSKTTTTITLAQQISEKGLRVLVIDLDPQGSLTHQFGMLPDSEVKDSMTLMPVYAGEQSLADSIVKTHWSGIDLVPSNLSVFGAEFVLNKRQEDAQKEGLDWAFYAVLDDALKEVENDYDVILFDSQPALGYVTTCAIYAAHSLIIPMPPSAMDFASSASFVRLLKETVSETEKLTGKRKVYDWIRVLITRHEKTDSHNTVSAWIRETYGRHVSQSPVYYTSVIPTLGMHMKSPYEARPGHDIKDRRTLLRALEILDASYNDIYALIRHHWQSQSILSRARKQQKSVSSCESVTAKGGA